MHSDEPNWNDNPIFAALSPSELVWLATDHPPRPIAPKGRLLHPGAAAREVAVLHHGAVQLRCQAVDDRTLTFALCRAPMLFGELELASSSTAGLTVEALTPCTVSVLSPTDFQGLLQRAPAAQTEALRHLAALALHGVRRLALASASLEAQVASLLLSYAWALGRDGDEISLPVTYREIAASLGVVGRSVAQVFMRLQRAEIVAVRPGEIRIRDRATLAARSAGDRAFCYRIGQRAPRSLPRHDAGHRIAIEVISGPPELVGRSLLLDEQALVGASARCELRLSAPGIDGRHARLFRAATGGRCWIEDLASREGVLVNGKKRRRAVLRDGDEIQLGPITLRAALIDRPDEPGR